jgi:hypothetical protein
MVNRRLFCTMGALALALVFGSEARAEKYPRMVAALGEMKEARRELKEAGTDFGGHKLKAIEALDVAIDQMDKALRAVGVNPVYVPPSKDVYKVYKNHPYIRHALAELRLARAELKDAATDFGGHKVKAIEAIDVAIVQLEKALEFAK